MNRKNKPLVYILALLLLLPALLLARPDSLDNRIGLHHLQSFYDNGNRASISSLEYARRLKNKSTLIGRLNYARRQAGDGWQGEAETYWVHTPRTYSYAGISVSDGLVFPELKAGYSLFRGFDKGWEGDLGYRFLRAQGMDMHSLSWGLGKYLGNFWLNLHGYVIRDAGKTHQSYRLTGRYYLNDRLDYATVMVFTGTSPDDRSRNFQYNSFSSFISGGMALGYKRSFGGRYEAKLIGSWNKQKISDTDYLHQLDVSVSVFRNF